MVDVRHDGALHLPAAGLWLDPRHSKPLAFVSHAHCDHTGRHERTIATPLTLRFMEARMGALCGDAVPLPFDEVRDFGSFRIRLVPAGHVLGSAQAWIETDGGTLLYTGDFKLRQGISAETAGAVHAGTLVMETTYGLPRYVFPPFEEVFAGILKFCTEALEDGETPVLLGYSLGKAQEILAGLEGAGFHVMLHPSIARLVPFYREAGIAFPETTAWNPRAAGGHVLICPPGAAGGKAMATIPGRRVAAVTGWAMDAGAVHRMRCDAAFALSDHAGYDDLLRHVERVAPKRVLTVHGFAAEFAADLRSRGIEAWALTGPNQLDFGLRLPDRTRVVPPLETTAPPEADGFLGFCNTCDAIAGLTGKKAKTAVLAAFFKSLRDSELELAAVWLSGRAFPASDSAPHQAGRAVVSMALMGASGLGSSDFKAVVRGLNDLGRTARTVMEAQPASGNPSIEQVGKLLRDIRAARGGLAKSALLEAFFRVSHPACASHLVKILSGDLRIGLKEGLLEEALAEAFGVPLEEIREANMLQGHLGFVACMARDQRLHERKTAIFHPVKCMLASPEPDAMSVRRRFAHLDTVWLEPKFDGIRAQVHSDGWRTEIFTRDQKCITPSFPELAAPRLGRTMILDGEILAWRNGRPLPFQDLQRRLGRVEADLFLGGEIPVVFQAFDLLLLDNENLLKAPLGERRALLETIAWPAGFQTAPRLEAATAGEIDIRFDAVRKSGHEGLIAKDPFSAYTPGRRGPSWIKLKKRLATLDVVVVAAEYGHGKRRAVLSDYTFALRDQHTGGLVTLGKAYTGLTDREIASLTDEFLASALSKSGNMIHVEPRVVLEIAFDSIRPSRRHDSGLALRFPRIVRLRRDKSATEIDTLESAKKLVTEGPV
jgi:DNA ligase-1